VDRDNDLVNHLYEPLNPAILRLIHHVIRAAQDAGKPVTLCGEMAGTPTYIPLLVGMGVTDLSMNPPALLEARKAIRDMAFESWQGTASAVCELASLEMIKQFVENERSRTADERLP
jgi:phosphotransferase system enzyme I (PtsI)